MEPLNVFSDSLQLSYQEGELCGQLFCPYMLLKQFLLFFLSFICLLFNRRVDLIFLALLIFPFFALAPANFPFPLSLSWSL